MAGDKAKKLPAMLGDIFVAIFLTASSFLERPSGKHAYSARKKRACRGIATAKARTRW